MHILAPRDIVVFSSRKSKRVLTQLNPGFTVYEPLRRYVATLLLRYA
jgi:hypothetical protein